MSQEESSEAHLSAQRPAPCEAARVPQADVDPSRSRRAPQPAPEGPRPPVGLISPLRDRATLLRVREDGRRGRSGPVSVRYVPVGDDERRLVAYAIGRHCGTAVVRNRIRRRLRPLVAEMATSGQLPPGAFVVSAGAQVSTAPIGAVRRHLAAAVARSVAEVEG